MRGLLVFGAKTFKIRIPDDAKVTFGPFSPPSSGKNEQWQAAEKRGTLRIYNTLKDVIAVFSQVDGFRDLSISYMEEVAVEQGATIWKDDQHGYVREQKQHVTHQWVDPTRQLKAKGAKSR